MIRKFNPHNEMHPSSSGTGKPLATSLSFQPFSVKDYSSPHTTPNQTLSISQTDFAQAWLLKDVHLAVLSRGSRLALKAWGRLGGCYGDI